VYPFFRYLSEKKTTGPDFASWGVTICRKSGKDRQKAEACGDHQHPGRPDGPSPKLLGQQPARSSRRRRDRAQSVAEAEAAIAEARKVARTAAARGDRDILPQGIVFSRRRRALHSLETKKYSEILQTQVGTFQGRRAWRIPSASASSEAIFKAGKRRPRNRSGRRSG